jgi:hypothetical protein
MIESEPPTLPEFLQRCREAFRFLMDDFSFREAPCSVPKERFCVRFENDNQSVEIRGEGYGKTADCRVSCGQRGPMSLTYLIPDTSRPKRSRKRDQMGQLDHIRELGELARAHATDFFGGDIARFARIWDRQRKR